VTIIATQTRRKAMTTNCIKFINDRNSKRNRVDLNSQLRPRHHCRTHHQRQPSRPNASGSLGRSPRGKLVECGGIWKKQNKETGADYFTLTIRDHAFNANLGIAASQDDRPSSPGARRKPHM